MLVQFIIYRGIGDESEIIAIRGSYAAAKRRVSELRKEDKQIGIKRWYKIVGEYLS